MLWTKDAGRTGSVTGSRDDKKTDLKGRYSLSIVWLELFCNLHIFDTKHCSPALLFLVRLMMLHNVDRAHVTKSCVNSNIIRGLFPLYYIIQDMRPLCNIIIVILIFVTFSNAVFSLESFWSSFKTFLPQRFQTLSFLVPLWHHQKLVLCPHCIIIKVICPLITSWQTGVFISTSSKACVVLTKSD